MLTGAELAASLYATLDVFVHTSPFETFGQAVQEAMASGIAVVAPDAGGPRELVQHGHTGYLVPRVRRIRCGTPSYACVTTPCCGTPSAGPRGGPCAGEPGRWSATS